MKKNKIIVLSGPVGSGKSTLVKEMLLKDGNLIRISRDSIRTCLRGDRGIEHEKLVTKVHDEALNLAVESGYDVILDSTNVHFKTLMERLKVWSKLGALEIIYMPDISLAELKERNETRPDDERLPPRVVTDMHSKYRHLLTKTDDIQEFLDNYQDEVITPYVQNPCKEECIVIDIDSTVALKGDRHHYDWSRVLEDVPLIDMVNTVDAFETNVKRIYLTGRSEVCRKATEEWLELNLLPCDKPYLLLMRGETDFSPATTTKRHLFETHVLPNYYTLAWFDDDERIIKQFGEMGINTLKVNNGRK